MIKGKRTYENEDIQFSPILKIGIGLALLTIGGLVSSYFLFHYFARQANPVPAFAGPDVAPQPRLQLAPRQDIEAMRRTSDGQLNSYGWVDKPAGVAHIPIERAMEIVLQKGLPAREAGRE